MKTRPPRSIVFLLTVTFSLVSAVTVAPTGNAGLFGGGTSVASAKTMIRSLMYQYSQNCTVSYERCVKFTLTNEYPNYLNILRANACAKIQNPYTATAIVELNSVAPDKMWTLRPPIYKDENSKIFGISLKGDTFIATLTFSYQYSSGAVDSQTSDLHFIILNKKAYYFFNFCNN